MLVNFVKACKNNPLKILFGSTSSIVAIVTALFAVDARYAHAADVEKDKVQTQKIIQETTTTLRRQMLEDKVFEIDLKKTQSKDQKLRSVDQALRDRYQQQLNDISRSQVK